MVRSFSNSSLFCLRPSHQLTIPCTEHSRWHRQLTSALGAAQLGLDGGGVGVAIVPQCSVDQAHRVRVGRVAAARLVGGEEDLCAFQRGNSNVLTDVGVIYPDCYTT
jgi:hypothetical protein